MPSSLYIHIPFCKRRCIYCDFYSTIYDESLAVPYIDSLITQLNKLNGKFSTIYIGGGTPTALNTALLDKLLRILSGRFENNAEFTIEVNPESFDKDKAKLFLNHGVNRLSIGFQSINDKKLKALGRLHDSKKADEAVSLAGKSGFKNISIDLIFGVWSEDLKSWKAELKEAVKLPVQHISCYSLTYEKGTPLWDALRNGSVKPHNEDLSASMYECAIDALSLYGFKQYEVSNFAKKGYEAKHNLNYWDNNPYVGLGASAASYADGVRSKNISDIREYIRRVEAGKSVVESSERLSPAESARETAAVKIRTKAGIGFEWFKKKTGFDFMELERKAVKKLIEDDLIHYDKKGDSITGISLKRKGFLFCDTVSSALL